ncbi:MAG: PKD domain-containing protein [Euryarchaeota archaeon]|nr:PKD domain-containing protein [Euryarchaeota archaeon]MDE1881086.1 PKD domain-containing protein [Euryarchaeota archaeon]MDE2043548.1 PKD domain-containing protein [Thermoplasmata archaeon]
MLGNATARRRGLPASSVQQALVVFIVVISLSPLFSELDPALEHAKGGAGLGADRLSMNQGSALAPSGASSARDTPSATPLPLWMNLSASLPSAPSPRFGAMEAYDPSDGYTVLFGGLRGTIGFLNDTWTFKAGVWTNLTPTIGAAPIPRRDGGLVYDPAGPFLVLFGGCDVKSGCGLNDTWTFHAGRWTEISTGAKGAPSGRGEFALSYVASYGHPVLFGGFRAGHDLSDTWALKGTFWANLTPVQSLPLPIRRSMGAFADAPALAEGVLFGGLTGTRPQGDTWAFRGGNWTNLTGSLAVAPAARYGSGLAFDTAQGDLLLYGGCSAAGCFVDSWTFTGPGWSKLALALSPGPVNYFSMSYDGHDGYALLFGGRKGATDLAWTWAFGLPVRIATPVPTPKALDVGGTLNLWSNTSGGNGSYSWWWHGLPSGCASVNASHLACTPGVPGSSNITASVNASNGLRATSLWVVVPIAPAPTVALSRTPPVGEGATTVGFTSVGSGGTGPFTYFWEFGDGNIGLTRNATHVYALPRNYTATVWFNDSTGSSASASVWVDVTAALSVTTALSSNFTLPHTTVNLDSAVKGGWGSLSYAWSLNGTALSNGLSPSISFTPTGAGNFTFSLLVTDGLGAQARSTSVLRVVAPASSGSPTPSGSQGFVQDLMNYSWVFLLGAVLGVAVGAVVVLLLSRRKRNGSGAGQTPVVGPPPSPMEVVPPGPPAAPPGPPYGPESAPWPPQEGPPPGAPMAEPPPAWAPQSP